MWSPLPADGDGDGDPFDLPPLSGLPSSENTAPYDIAHDHDEEPRDDGFDRLSDQFVDAETFMADHRPGEDSFLREATGSGDVAAVWGVDDGDVDAMSLDASDRRASAIFVPKSRNMDKVEFSSPEPANRKSVSVHQEVPLQMKIWPSVANSNRQTAFSASNTAISSDYEIHVDNRLILTPNSFKYLQQRERQPTEDFTLSPTKSEGDGEHHSFHARQVVDANAHVIQEIPSVPSTPARPSSAEKAMHAGPGVIKKALHEIESMLRPLSFDEVDSDVESELALDKLKSRLRNIPLPVGLRDLTKESKGQETHFGGDDRDVEELQKEAEMKTEGAQADRNPALNGAVQAYSHSCTETTKSPFETELVELNRLKGDSLAADALKTMTIVSLKNDERSRTMENYDNDELESEKFRESSYAARQGQRVDAWAAAPTHTAPTDVSELRTFSPRRPARPKEVRAGTAVRRASLRQSLEDQTDSAYGRERANLNDNSSTHIPQKPRDTRVRAVDSPKKYMREEESIKATVGSLPLAASVPNQMARRCRRFLCTVGEQMSEQIVFSNGSSKVGRICVSLLPLSTGCQQFSVVPAVLELQPRSRSAFTVTFDASRPGVVAGIFQFRAVGVDGLYEPYEVLIEASVRGDLQLAPGLPRPKRPPSASKIKTSSLQPRVTELPAQALAGVQISPTFIRFTTSTSSDGQGVIINGPVLRITNTTSESVEFQVKSSYEHLHLSRSRGKLLAGTEVNIEIRPICLPFGFVEDMNRDWCGSVTVIVGDVLSREVSIVIDRNALISLPTFDDAARVRQSISAQTDSFYYTKKVNRRGLYFHARAVECGSCVVGESHQVPVYICNGSDTPMTVFLQSLQAPFSCEFQPTTLQARKFIEVPVTFRPKATGKVATCLVAYTVSGKAAVTLIARGIDKGASSAQVHL